MLLREFKGTSYWADGYWNARKLLVRAVGFLGGREMKDYVADFLDSTVVWMKFAVEEEEDSETEDEVMMRTTVDSTILYRIQHCTLYTCRKL